MTVLKKTFVIVAMFAALGLVYYEANQSATLRIQVQALQRQQASLSTEIWHLHSERINAAKSQGTSVGTGIITGLLTDPNYRVVIHALEQRSGFENLAEPEAVSITGRGENRMRATDITINLISSPAFIIHPGQ